MRVGRSAWLLGHPVVVVSLAALVLNDHVAKVRWPGPVTGLTSDLAGLVLLPAIMVAAVAVVRGGELSWLAVASISAVVALAFAFVELVPIGDHAYEVGWGAISQPVRAALGGGHSTTVTATADPLDLLALPAAALVPWLWHRGATA